MEETIRNGWKFLGLLYKLHVGDVLQPSSPKHAKSEPAGDRDVQETEAAPTVKDGQEHRQAVSMSYGDQYFSLICIGI